MGKAKKKKSPSLTPRQVRFVDEYMIDLNATQAAIRAGYSEKTAYSQGQRLLKNVEAQNAISNHYEKRSKRTAVTADKVLKELARVGFFDLACAVSVEGGKVVVKDTSSLSEDDRRALAEVCETKTQHGGTLRVKAHDKMKALEMLGKHLGMFRDNAEAEDVPLPTQVNIQIVDSRKKE